MKNLTLFILFIFLIACKSENKNDQDTNTNTNTNTVTSTGSTVSHTESDIVSDFLSDISTLKNIDKGNPIQQFQDLASKKANKTFSLSENNIAEILIEAKNYKHCVITTENHTIIKVTDLNDCKQSGSWKACMPYAKGFIKKGALSFKEDYMNNIIGIPDSQIRKVFLFN